MKKLYVLLFTILITSLSFGQELLLNGTLESWDDSTTPTSWTKAENTDQESTEIHGGTYSVKHTASGTKDLTQNISGITPGNSYTITIWYKVEAGSGDGTDARIWSYWLNGSSFVYDDADALRGPAGGYFDNNGNIWTEYTTTVTAPAGVDGFRFELRAYGSAVVYWDDLSFFAEAASMDPSLLINSPTEGSTLLVDNTDVTFLVQNFDVATAGLGDGHIHYTVDGGGTVMKYDTDPISLAGLSDGSHTVYMELVDDGHTAIAPAVNATVNFNTNNITQTLPVSESFSYADGSLDGNGLWLSFGGTDGDLLVSSGQAVLQMGGGSEDISLVFTSVSGSLYYGLDFSVDDLGAPYTGTDNEYFAHFKTGGFDYSARLDIVAPTGGGDFSVGIASDESTADTVWATDLTYGTTYRVIVKYDQDTNQAQLWIDASVDTDPSILGEDRTDPGDSVSQFAFRQSGSSENEIIRVDNLSIGSTFGAVTLGTSDFKQDQFKLYPNPTSTGFVNIVSRYGETINARVFDILGKQVINSTVTNNKLDVSNLNTGVYIIRLTQNNSTVTKKLIIN